MPYPRVARWCDRAVLVATAGWAIYGLVVLFVVPSPAPSEFDFEAISQTTMPGGYFIILSALFVPLYLYAICLLAERASRAR